ncbi:hypothetical protein OG21DRAFT_1492261 [Imleria badia]|nr:hypothetical protein OG21DRAFT_1492261 [Imleria badia]
MRPYTPPLGFMSTRAHKSIPIKPGPKPAWAMVEGSGFTKLKPEPYQARPELGLLS